jgi:protein phosphatase-4 regulatory subunit 3
VVEKVLRLTRRRERYLVVAAIRFLRTCIGLKNDFYAHYVIKNNLFAPVVEAFKANGDKYNMLNSAVIEMVDYICKV